MRFRTFGVFIVVFLACLMSVNTPSAQDFSKVQIRSDKVADSVYVLYASGGNVGVLTGENGVVLVDSSFPQLHEKVRAALAQFAAGNVRFVLNTNGHYDHALGNELFVKEGAVVVGHENARRRMTAEQVHAVLDAKTAPYPAMALPQVTFADAMALHANGEDIEAMHVIHAHSDSDAVYRFRRANVIHTGDVFFSEAYPYIDITNGGSITGTIAAADRVLRMADAMTKIIPGHGRVSDRQRLQAYRNMLVTIRDRMTAMIKEGRKLDAIVASKPTAQFDKDWTGGVGMSPDLFVTLVYRDLARGASD